MKRSKIFLGVSSVCLAIVGIAATKAHKSNSTFYYYQQSLTNCALANISDACPKGASQACIHTVGDGTLATFTIYTQSNAAKTTCLSVLQTKP